MSLSRNVKRILIKAIGTQTDEIYWRFRHIFEIGWPKSYISLNSIESPHRKVLIEKILGYSPKSVLEFGCASGPNLALLKDKEIEIVGIDISGEAIKEAERYFKGCSNIKLIRGNEKALKKIKDKSIDIVFTDAVLIYFGPDKIIKVINEMRRIAKKAVILLEMNGDGSYKDNWMHDYKKLAENVEVEAIPEEIWEGGRHIIVIKA